MRRISPWRWRSSRCERTRPCLRRMKRIRQGRHHEPSPRGARTCGVSATTRPVAAVTVAVESAAVAVAATVATELAAVLELDRSRRLRSNEQGDAQLHLSRKSAAMSGRHAQLSSRRPASSRGCCYPHLQCSLLRPKSAGRCERRIKQGVKLRRCAGKAGGLT